MRPISLFENENREDQTSADGSRNIIEVGGNPGERVEVDAARSGRMAATRRDIGHDSGII